MVNKCAMCETMENLQTHHWLYGDKEMDEKWTVTLCVECHQKLHSGHGVGRGEGHKLKKSPETALRFFKAILKNPQITTIKLAREAELSEVTVRKLRMRWGLHKRSLVSISKAELEKKILWQLYTFLENTERTRKRGRKYTVTVKIKGESLRQIRAIRSDREKITGKPTSIAELVREAIRFWYKLKHQQGGEQ